MYKVFFKIFEGRRVYTKPEAGTLAKAKWLAGLYKKRSPHLYWFIEYPDGYVDEYTE